MLFTHWPLVYIVLMNTEFCKNNAIFRKSSIFTMICTGFFFFVWTRKNDERQFLTLLTILLGHCRSVYYRFYSHETCQTCVKMENVDAASGTRQATSSNEKSSSVILDKFRQFPKMLFSQWPLVLTLLINTDFCKIFTIFRKSSIFTMMHRFFIFRLDNEK